MVSVHKVIRNKNRRSLGEQHRSHRGNLKITWSHPAPSLYEHSDPRGRDLTVIVSRSLLFTKVRLSRRRVLGDFCPQSSQRSRFELIPAIIWACVDTPAEPNSLHAGQNVHSLDPPWVRVSSSIGNVNP